MSNYYKYYHLRASPIGKYEQQQSPNPYAQNQQPLQYSSSIRTQETSPWRNIPQQPTIVQSQQVASYPVSDKTMLHLSLEKQNECLRKEKTELENQIQKLKQYYTKQTSSDQQELMRYEREKASLTDKLREMDQVLTNLQEKYEKELNTEKNTYKKQRQEQESKIEKMTQHYNEQIAQKQDEIHKTQNKLQLFEINAIDLSARLKIYEQTNNEIRTKWDEDIKNFGQELESLNKQLLSERFRNDELERLSKINQQANGSNTASVKDTDDNNTIYLKEIEALKNQNLELRNKNFELERKVQTFDSNSTSESNNAQSNSYKEKLEQKIKENEQIKADLNKKISEVEIITKDSQILQNKLTKSEKDNSDKDILVQQMIIHIEQIEKENKEQQVDESFNGIEEKLKQVYHENQIQKKELEFFASELQRITNRNKLLEEQLYQPETQINSHRQYQLLEKQIDQIDMKCNKIQLEVNKKEETIIHSQRGNTTTQDEQKQSSFGDVSKDITDLQNEVQSARTEINNKKQQLTQEVNKETNNVQYQPFAINNLTEDQRARQITANFTPQYEQRHKLSFNSNHNDMFGNKTPTPIEEEQIEQKSHDSGQKKELDKQITQNHQTQGNGSENKQQEDKISVQLKGQSIHSNEASPKPITPNQILQSVNSPAFVNEFDNGSQQTFGCNYQSTCDQAQQLQEFVNKPDNIKEDQNKVLEKQYKTPEKYSKTPEKLEKTPEKQDKLQERIDQMMQEKEKYKQEQEKIKEQNRIKQEQEKIKEQNRIKEEQARLKEKQDKMKEELEKIKQEQDKKYKQTIKQVSKSDEKKYENSPQANPKPLHQQLKELSEQFGQGDFKPIHPMNITPKVSQQKPEQKVTVQANTFMDSFRAQEQPKLPDPIIPENFKLNDVSQTESYIADHPIQSRLQQQQQQEKQKQLAKTKASPTPQRYEAPQKYEPPQKQEPPTDYSKYKIENLKNPRIDQQLIELDIVSILSHGNQVHSKDNNVRHLFDRKLEGNEVFDIIVGFVGVPKSGKSTVINSIRKEDWDIVTKTESCNKKLQIFRYSCMSKKVGLCESDMIKDQSFMHFICNFTQAIVLFFNSWEAADETIFTDYVKLLQSDINFASECIVIHSDSEKLSSTVISKMTQDLTKLQDGLYRGKVDGKLKKINVYHLMLHNYNDKSKKQSIFEETIAVCRGTIIGKLTTNKEKVDVFKRVNKFLIN